MGDDQFNISIRKFLKTVGITSQEMIEEAASKREKTDATTCDIKIKLICDELHLDHQINGQIELPKK